MIDTIRVFQNCRGWDKPSTRHSLWNWVCPCSGTRCKSYHGRSGRAHNSVNRNWNLEKEGCTFFTEPTDGSDRQWLGIDSSDCVASVSGEFLVLNCPECL
jgi:hypothetical protein